MRGTGAARRRKGDGIGLENVPLAPRRGKNRRLREVPRHLQGRCATDSTEGDKSGQKSLAVPMLGRNCQKSLAVPTLSGAIATNARRFLPFTKTWRPLWSAVA